MCNLISTASTQVSTPSAPLFVANPLGSGSVMQYKTIDCATNLLAAGDVIWQQYSTGTHTVTHRYEVIANNGKLDRDHQLTLKDLDTDEVKDVLWPGGDKQLCAGPKVDAFKANPRLCTRVTSTSRPRWAPETIDTAAPVTGKLPTVLCQTSQLEPGDVFTDRPRKHGGGHSEARIEVLEVGAISADGKSVRLYTKNHLNNDVSWGGWSEGQKTVTAGPKCLRYQSGDRQPFIHSRGTPVWVGLSAKV